MLPSAISTAILLAGDPSPGAAGPPTVRDRGGGQVTNASSTLSKPGSGAAGAAAPPAAAGPPRRTAWAEGVDRLRAAATTEPGRLRIIGAVVAGLLLTFGVVTAYQVTDRAAAAEDVVGRSQPLSADAADIYRSLADADTASASGFLIGGQEPREVRERYEQDIAMASRLLVRAASTADGSSESGQAIARLNEQLPRYTGLIEAARANNRQGLPLGGAYLRYANEQMSTQLLPAAQRLYEAETRRLYQDYDGAKAWPVAALGAGLVALAVLVWVQRRTYRHTHRVFNPGLLAATGAATVVLLWLAVGHTVARAGLADSHVHGQQSLKVLSDARISSLQARANENLTLVARGAVLAQDNKSDKYDSNYAQAMAELKRGLTEAARLADDRAGSEPVQRAAAGVLQWTERHRTARETDNQGDYEGALEKVLGSANSTGQSFDEVDASIHQALEHEQAEFTRAADGGRRALDGLAIGAAVLAVLGAVAALLGIGRRLSEYR
ncbi:hypothetical protein [Streptomyces sp. NPDC006879]|uniref:hypothetical protein n=1 Tax=Streptomyces sp. NPDC006879 TaxID=3364767 RepID=UPI0036AF06CC